MIDLGPPICRSTRQSVPSTIPTGTVPGCAMPARSSGSTPRQAARSGRSARAAGPGRYPFRQGPGTGAGGMGSDRRSAGLEPTAAEQMSLTTLDGPPHAALRTAFAPLFSAQKVRSAYGRMLDIARSLLADIAADEVDLVADFSTRYPLTILCDLLRHPRGPRRSCHHRLPADARRLSGPRRRSHVRNRRPGRRRTRHRRRPLAHDLADRMPTGSTRVDLSIRSSHCCARACSPPTPRSASSSPASSRHHTHRSRRSRPRHTRPTPAGSVQPLAFHRHRPRPRRNRPPGPHTRSGRHPGHQRTPRSRRPGPHLRRRTPLLHRNPTRPTRTASPCRSHQHRLPEGPAPAPLRRPAPRHPSWHHRQPAPHPADDAHLTPEAETVAHRNRPADRPP